MLLLPTGNTPRWVILLTDVFLCAFALALAYAIRFDFAEPNSQKLLIEWKVLKPSIFFYFFVRILSFVFTKTYSGIIRFTSTQDAKRLFLVLLSGSILFSIFSIVRYYFLDGVFFLPWSILLLEFLLSFFLLISMRVSVKLLYLEQNKSRGATKNIVIYGAGEMGMTTKKILENDSTALYNIIGFIDDNPLLQNKFLERTPIKSSKHLETWRNKKEIDAVIIAIKNPKKETKTKIIDQCLALDIDLLTVPPIEQWMNGGFTAKQIKKIKIEDLLGRKEIQLNETNITNFIKNKVILVTGGAGSIGSEIVRQVLKYAPSKVVVLDQAESPLYDLGNELKNKYVDSLFELVIADVSSEQRMRRVFEFFKPEVVFHAAAYKHVPLMEENPAEAIKVNVLGSKILAKLSNEFNVSSFVMISTDKAVNPTNVMGASKRIAEMYIQALSKQSNTKFTTTRFGNVLGSNGSVIPLFKKQIENGGPITVTDERITRFFMTIPEACQLVLEAGTMGEGGEVYVFDMGESIKIVDLAEKMIKLSGLELGKDIEIKITGLRPGEKLYEELLNNEENTIPTHHEKILIGKVKEYEYHTLNELIMELISLYNQQNNDAIVSKMKEIVPEYISNNSIFSKFDA